MSASARQLSSRERRLVPRGVSATGGPIASRLGRISWMAFESGRNPYALLISLFLFAPYFSNVVVGDPVRGQALIGALAAYSGIAIALLAPFLGAIADAGGRRKPWLAFYVIVLAVVEILMWQIKPGATGQALFFGGALIAIGNVSFEFSAVFHNALLPSIAPADEVAKLSGFSIGMASLAGLLLLLLILIGFSLPGTVDWFFVPAHPLFNIDPAAHEPERLAGPICAIWLIVFSLPLFLFTPDRVSNRLGLRIAMITGVQSVIRTLSSLRNYRNVGTYLVARLFFNDGLTACVTFNGIFAAGIFHLGTPQMLVFGIECCLCSVLGGFFGGWLDYRLGSKRALFITVGGTTLLSVALLTFAPDRILWFVHYDVNSPPLWKPPFFNTWPQLLFLLVTDASVILATAIYANARTMLIRIAPPQHMTEFFGLYSLSGTSTTFMATGVVAWLTAVAASQRVGLLAEAVFLSIGLFLLIFVREERAAV